MQVKTILSVLVGMVIVNEHSCSTLKGLFLMTIGSKSHMIFYSGIIEALIQNGNEITLVSPFKSYVEHENLTSILLDYNSYHDQLTNNTFETSFLETMANYLELTKKMCYDALENPEVKKALAQKYDYAILSLFGPDCFLPYVYEKKIHLIYATPNSLMTPYSERFGAPEFPSVSPNKMMSFSYPMTFWERLVTAVGGVVYDRITYYFDEKMEEEGRERNVWSPETPSIWELQELSTIAIINSFRALEIPTKSTPPTIIYAGGIQIKEAMPLPKDLEDWLNGSGEAGFILFSLGTAVKPSDMKEEHLQIILNVFRGLKQRIIWKWDTDGIQNLPPNVKLASWLPQNDILAHPKIRLFITHGGMLSTQEATYFGVPVVGMPVFGDQVNNVAEVVAEQWGRQVLWAELSEERFRDVVIETMTDSSIRETAARRSKLMRDWPRTASEEVVYWVDYVIRHNGARHLQSPLVHLKWYQIYNIDVWLLTLVICFGIIMILILLIRTCLKQCMKRCFKRKTE